MFKAGIPLAASFAAVLFGQTEAVNEIPFAGPVTTASAVGALSWALWYFFKDSTRQREDFKTTLDSVMERHERMQKDMADRHDKWEECRHEDSQHVSESLNKLAINCSESRSKNAD
jgi:hypothetical protein